MFISSFEAYLIIDLSGSKLEAFAFWVNCFSSRVILASTILFFTWYSIFGDIRPFRLLMLLFLLSSYLYLRIYSNFLSSSSVNYLCSLIVRWSFLIFSSIQPSTLPCSLCLTPKCFKCLNLQRNAVFSLWLFCRFLFTSFSWQNLSMIWLFFLVVSAHRELILGPAPLIMALAFCSSMSTFCWIPNVF